MSMNVSHMIWAVAVALATASAGYSDCVPHWDNAIGLPWEGREPETGTRALGRLRASLADQIVRIGGSNAQREVFEDTLLEAYLHAGRYAQAEALLCLRLGRRPRTRARARRGAARRAAGRTAPRGLDVGLSEGLPAYSRAEAPAAGDPPRPSRARRAPPAPPHRLAPAAGGLARDCSGSRPSAMALRLPRSPR
jgi:hypothetical protein